MSNRRDLDRLWSDVGDLVARHDDARGLDEYGEYRDDPVAFIKEVTGGEPWAKQRKIAEAVRDHRRVSVRSCHASGKDWLAARLALWWTYSRQGLVLLTGPTQVQVVETLMRKEVHQAFTGSGLPGDLHVRALRPISEGRAGILAKTASGVSALTGFHDSRVLFIITEAQEPEIEHAWDAAFACTTGAEDRILTIGNPTEKGGRFYRAHRPGSGWKTFQIRAADIPNVQEGKTVIQGLLSREGIEAFRLEYGEQSGFFISRVHAEFPEESEEGVFRRSWLEAAADRWDQGDLEGRAQGAPQVAGLDPARGGPNASVLGIRQGPVLRALVAVEGASEGPGLRDRILAELGARGLGPEEDSRLRALVVDEVGVGGFLADLLAEAGLPVWGFNGGRKAGDTDRFQNVRAESFWRLRLLLQRGLIALPRDEQLWEELLALRWRLGADGRVQLEAKRDLSSRLGRSPDRADAVAMSFYLLEDQLPGPRPEGEPEYLTPEESGGLFGGFDGEVIGSFLG